MTEATRQALERVDQILQQAGWDQPAGSESRLMTPEELAQIRHAYESLLRLDHFEILTATLGNGLTVEQAGEKMGLGEEDARGLFYEALRRLSDFVEVYDGDACESKEGITLGKASRPS